MKRFPCALALVLIVLTAPPADAARDSEWFDFTGCAMCSRFHTEPDLLAHLTWEHHLIADGVMMITTVEPEWKDAYERVRGRMEKVGARMHGGESLHLCGFCTSMMGVFESGKARFEEVRCLSAWVMLMTSDDPETVERIKDHGRRSIEELAGTRLAN